MNIGLRTRLLLAILPAFAIIFGVGVFTTNWLVAGLSFGAALVSTGLIVALTSSFERLRFGAKESLHQSGIQESQATSQSGPKDGTGEIAQTISLLMDELTACRQELSQRNVQYENALISIGSALSTIQRDSRAPNKIAPIESPWKDKHKVVAESLSQIGQTVQNCTRRTATLLAILNDIPEPVIVMDPKLNIQFLNTAAETAFDQLPNKGLRQPFRAVLTDPPQLDMGSFEPSHCMKASDAILWLNQARGGSCEAVAKTVDALGTPFSLSLVPHHERKSPQSVVLLLRDLTNSKRTEAVNRQLHRRLIGQRISLLIAREAMPALEVIRTQAGLLAQAAKQAGQRERFVPKVQRIVEEVNRQELVVELLGWLGRLTTTKASEPDFSEVRLRTVADEVAEKITPALAERGNTLDVFGDAGWLIADEDRLGVMLTGLLVHANLSTEQTKIQLELRRRSAVSANDEMGEVLIRYTGAELTPALIEDIREPFRRANSAVFDSTGKVGFLLGPAVAHRVAGLMGGELEIQYQDGQVTLRVTVLTRERSEGRMSTQVITSDHESFVPGSSALDSLSEWAVGGGKVSVSDFEDLDETPVPAYAGDANPAETVDDSLGAFFGAGSSD
jgi:signal transduction histidine kinase